jgi:DNA-binding response OmpR family regulator
MSAALIVAEPETETRGFLERQLADDGFDVLGASHPGEVFDLAERDVPVILLGREAAGAVDRVRALERGADDYVDRPFAYEELRARIRAVLRRVAPRPGDVLEAGEIRIDRPTRCVQVAGRRLLLPAKEFELVAKLAEHPTRVYEKEELLREVWGFRSIGRTRTLDSHASRVRRRIGTLTKTPYVINQWGVGYRLMLPD